MENYTINGWQRDKKKFYEGNIIRTEKIVQLDSQFQYKLIGFGNFSLFLYFIWEKLAFFFLYIYVKS